MRSEYEATGTKLEGDGWVCSRTTMQRHCAEKEPFVSASKLPAGPQPVHVAPKAKSYAVSVDTTGKLRWASGDLDGDYLICIVSERAPEDYLYLYLFPALTDATRFRPYSTASTPNVKPLFLSSSSE